MVSKTKKLLASAMAVAVCAPVSVNAFALGTNINSIGSVAGDIEDNLTEDLYGSEVVGKDETQQKESEYQKFEVDDQAITAPSDVYATQATGEDVYDPDHPDADENGYVDGTVMVVIPKTVILNGKSGVGNYTVKVKGNIAGNEVITVAPEATVTLSQAGKADVVADITQPIQRFAYKDTTVVPAAADLAKEVTHYYYTAPDATIETKDLTAGLWHGTFDFTISFAAV